MDETSARAEGAAADALAAQVAPSSAAILRRDAAGFDGTLNDLGAVLTAHPGMLAAILDARARARSAQHVEFDDLLPVFGWKVGFAIAAADQVLERLGAPWDMTAMPNSKEEAWLMNLREGLDVYAQICWCLRFGYTAAAVALARRFLERWSFNLASSTGIWPTADEPDDDFYTRLWRYHERRFTDRDAGEDWAAMSELLHGRDMQLGSRALSLSLGVQPADQMRVHSFLVRASEFVLRQVRGAIHTTAQARGDIDAQDLSWLQAPVSAFPMTLPTPDFLFVFFEPFDYSYVTSERAELYSSWGAIYRRITARRAEDPVDLIPTDSWMALEERWIRGRDNASLAFAHERRILGDAFQPEVLRGTIAQYRAIGEMADLAAELISSMPQAQALRAAAASLESAWVLWLQDVDESMTCMRAALEATARARAYRLKPVKAADLEAHPRSRAPHRWVQLAGWGGLSEFVRALGEFTHFRARSRHTGSRRLLEAMQRSPHLGAEAHTARARALEETAFLLGHELGELLDQHDSPFAEPFRRQVLFMTAAESKTRVETWVNHARGFKGHDFGEPDFSHAPAADEPE
ncbi:hypothetical protein [uncultured Amnibacterium sp.]|uniref:hypothetical protein n=1 Tax=uncultured Amnibacterium sp. TaxID=1631851 RepID=UPI0035C9E06F